MNSTTTPIHIFRPGRHTSMSGEVIEFSEADIAATAKAYNPALHEAPLVVGHPRTDDPAQGWAQSLFVAPRGIYAVPRDVDPAFAEQVTRLFLPVDKHLNHDLLSAKKLM